MNLKKLAFGSLIGLGVLILPSMALADSNSASPNILPGFHQYNNENSTAYVANPGDVGASGKTVAMGDVAVHYQNNDALDPVIPFGTQLNMITPVRMVGADTNSSSISTFYVQDTGPGKGLSQYWIDIYWGTSGYLNGALEYGNTNLVSYTCYY